MSFRQPGEHLVLIRLAKTAARPGHSGLACGLHHPGVL